MLFQLIIEAYSPSFKATNLFSNAPSNVLYSDD